MRFGRSFTQQRFGGLKRKLLKVSLKMQVFENDITVVSV